MDKTASGEENHYFELESVKKETEAGIYDDVASDDASPATKRMSCEKYTKGAKKQRKESTQTENACKSDAVVVRRLLFITAAVVAVAFLTAVATLILALAMVMSRNDTTAALKDYGAVYAELKEMKQNISHIHSAGYKMMKDIEGKISSTRNTNTSDKNQGQNTTEIWPGIQKAVNASVNEKLIDVRQQILRLDQKVINTSKVQLSKGPPGYNGTQGPPGPPGPSASGKLSLCSYTTAPSAGTTPDTYANEVVQRTESAGKKFLGVNCDSNDAKLVKISSTESGGKRTYKCTCKGTLSSGDSNMYCYIHYWECPT